MGVGPLQINAFGVMIALGVVAATWLASRRFVRAGSGTADDMQSLAVWAVVSGLIGARRRGLNAAATLTAAAPAILLAQSIGRRGNWWNQGL